MLAALPVIVVLGLRTAAASRPIRQVVATGLRCLVAAMIIVALAEPEWVRTTDDQTVIFALDQSHSVPDASREEALTFIRQATAHMRPGKDRVALLGFAGQISVAQLPQAMLHGDSPGTAREPHLTDLAGALRLALGLFPPDTAKRLVVLSDGNENRGAASREADIYAALRIPVDVVPMRYEHSAEILVDRLSAPANAARDESIDLSLVIRSQVDATARLMLYHNEELVDLDPDPKHEGLSIQLGRGPNRFTVPVRLHETGVHRFEAVIHPDNPQDDEVVVNNRSRAFTIVGEPTRVLIVSDFAGGNPEADASSAAVLSAALRDGGIESEVVSVDALFADPLASTRCSTVILSNVSGFALSQAQHGLLASFVRDQGGGLIAIGGDQAFSVGGYAHTPLDEVLPVETSRDKIKLLSLGLVIVIDRSGSMSGEKINMARKAAIGAVTLLSPLDQIGVLAFDGMPAWIVPPQRATDRRGIARQLDAIGSGGGTNMYPALQQAHNALKRLDTNLKHMIVLTDGQSMPGEFDALAAQCKRDSITISTIAVGLDADQALLTRIANISGGRMYVAQTALSLPQIFVRETVLASRAGIFERPFRPQLVAAADEGITAGFTPMDIPPLRGHVVTATKTLADESLVRATDDGRDPILAHWQVGLGRSVAFTSGLWPTWGPDWVSWPGFSKFWTQAVRYVGRNDHPADLNVDASVIGDAGQVTVSAEHLPFHVQASISLMGRVVRPDYSTAPLQFERDGAGKFDASFPVDAPGTYLVIMPYTYSNGTQVFSSILRTGAVVSYSPEYRTLTHNEAALTDIARRTHGRMLSIDHPAAVFEKWSIRPFEVRRPVWDFLVQLAAALFLLDVAVRRIVLTPADVAGWLGRLMERLAFARPGADSNRTMDTLRGAKARARQLDERPTEVAPSRQLSQPLEPEPPVPNKASLTLDDSGPIPLEPKEPEPPQPSPPTSEGAYTRRLLHAKRRAQRDLDDENKTGT